MHEFKTLPLVEFKVTDEAAGTFMGRASTFDSVDSYGDSVAPGAYAKTISDFLKRGFIAWGHDWTNPIAMPIAAEERADGLYIEAKFHSDSEAQKYRTRAKERMEAGQFMGLSIGFEAKSWHMDNDVRVLDEIKLYEVSLVTVPAEQNAGLVAVKGFGLSFEGHSEHVRDAVNEWLERCRAGTGAEVKVGRAISESRRKRIESVSGTLKAAAEELDELIAAKVDDDEEEGEAVVGLASDPITVIENPDLKHLKEQLDQFDAYYKGVLEESRWH